MANDYKVKDIGLADFGRKEIKLAEKEMWVIFQEETLVFTDIASLTLERNTLFSMKQARNQKPFTLQQYLKKKKELFTFMRKKCMACLMEILSS